MTEPARKGVVLEPTVCAICGTLGNTDELYPATLDESSFSESIFSARRLPDRIHYRMVRCRNCGLVRSDPAAAQTDLSELYRRSTFDYAPEVPNLRRTYSRYLTRARRYTKGWSLLEVGCGSGFMRPGLFDRGEFDTACLFQVFDHLPEPGVLLDLMRTALSAGGVLLCFNHNVESASAQILGERSPIVDIEHCYLYSPRTMRVLFEKHGFDVLESGAATNTLSLRHFLHLLPAPAALKRRLMSAAGRTRIDGVPLRLRLGNLYTIGRVA